MKIGFRLGSIVAFGIAIAAWGQQGVPPTPKPADSGPTLAATLQFIQEKLSEQGKVGWAETYTNQPGATYRHFVLVADVMADPAACTLFLTEAVDQNVDIAKGTVLSVGGKQVSAEDFRIHVVETESISFKRVEKITVEKRQDLLNKALAEAAHPDIKVTVTPSVFLVMLSASDAVFSEHSSTTKGSQAPVEKDGTSKTNVLTFRDEETANRVAKAMTHAMELCGGGVTKKEVF